MFYNFAHMFKPSDSHNAMMKTKLQCVFCPKQCGDKTKLAVHIRMHHTNERPFKCSLCRTAFADQRVMLRHQESHSAVKPFVCTECSRSFTRKSTLVQHSLMHRGIKFPCSLCSKSFTRAPLLTFHVRRQHLGKEQKKPPEVPQVYQCARCGKRKTSKGNLTKHIIQHLAARPYQCPECPKAFKQCHALTIHRRRHSHSKTSFACGVCRVTFLRAGELERHKRCAHSHAKPFQCAVCLKRVALIDNLHTHLKRGCCQRPRKLRVPNKWRFDCAQCDARFKSKATLSIHAKSRHCVEGDKHQGPAGSVGAISCSGVVVNSGTTQTVAELKQTPQAEEPLYLCSECPAKFYNANEWTSHFSAHISHHGFKCGQCSASFRSSRGLKGHVTLHAFPPSFKQPSVVCSFCLRTFHNKTHLYRHLLRHLSGACGEKPFGCRFCATRFWHLQNMRKHERRHENPLKCPNPKCPECFLFKRQLKSHARSHEQKTIDRYRCAVCYKYVKQRRTLVAHHHAMHPRKQSAVRLASCSPPNRKSTSRVHQAKIKSVAQKSQLSQNDVSSGGQTVVKFIPEVGFITVKDFEEPKRERLACAMCGATFSQSRWLERHEESHTASKLRRFKCRVCTASFSAYKLLWHHMLLHSTEKRFQCCRCLFTTKTKKGLTSHLLATHSNEKPFACRFCLASFKRQTHWHRHERSVHNCQGMSSKIERKVNVQ